jgi:N-acetyl-anhydromuramyl-L-alanine amidase AmpD
MFKKYRSSLVILLLFLLTACATNPVTMNYTLNKTLQSPNQNSRIRTLVMHYTAINLPGALNIFMDPKKSVSAQYVVSDVLNESGKYDIYHMVLDSQRAWHAGVSYWRGSENLNSESIGIEIVNEGFPEIQNNLPVWQRSWYFYPKGQIQAVAELMRNLVDKYQIAPERVIGHSDIAPGRKFDPGPRFPWQEIYEKYGIGAWPNADAVKYYATYFPYTGNILDLQKKFEKYGYQIQLTGIFDTQTQNVVTAFQMHFQENDISGVPTTKTSSFLDALLEKYNSVPRPAIPMP